MRWRDFNVSKVGIDNARANILAACTELTGGGYGSSSLSADVTTFTCSEPCTQCVDLEYVWHLGERRGDACRAPLFWWPEKLSPRTVEGMSVCPHRGEGPAALPPQASGSSSIAVATLKGAKVRAWLGSALYSATGSDSSVICCMAHFYLDHGDLVCDPTPTMLDALENGNVKLADWLLHLMGRERPWRN